MSGDHEAMEPCKEWHCFNLSLLPEIMDSNNRTLRYCHVTYVFQSESALYSWLNVKELLARNRYDIWRLSDSNGIQIHNHLVHIVQATIECRFSLKQVRNMIITYIQVLRADKYLQHNSIIWPVWLKGWVFVYELSGCGWVQIPLLSLKLQISHLFRARIFLTFRQL